jgi:hypothetical protein
MMAVGVGIVSLPQHEIGLSIVYTIALRDKTENVRGQLSVVSGQLHALRIRESRQSLANN